MSYAKISPLLKTKIQGNGENTESSQKRRDNIRWVENLDRSGLDFKQREKQVLIKRTISGDILSIQYPGKESKTKDEKHRPWDFRPKLFLNSENRYHKDLSFANIWGMFLDKRKLAEEGNRETLRILAVLIYRMAYLLDHQHYDKFEAEVKKASYTNDSEKVLKTSSQIYAGPIFLYSPPKEVLEELHTHISTFGAISLEALLHYSDLLAWNEDCKYYYRNHHTELKDKLLKKGKPLWQGSTGRINNLLSHFSILGALIGDTKFEDIMGRLTRGVAKPTQEEVRTISGGLIE